MIKKIIQHKDIKLVIKVPENGISMEKLNDFEKDFLLLPECDKYYNGVINCVQLLESKLQTSVDSNIKSRLIIVYRTNFFTEVVRYSNKGLTSYVLSLPNTYIEYNTGNMDKGNIDVTRKGTLGNKPMQNSDSTFGNDEIRNIASTIIKLRSLSNLDNTYCYKKRKAN